MKPDSTSASGINRSGSSLVMQKVFEGSSQGGDL